MNGFLGLDAVLRYGGLHVVRIMGAVWFLPWLNPGPASRLIRLGLGLLLGVTVAVARFGNHFQDPGGEPLVFTIMLLKELTFGLLLGWLAGLMLEAMKVAGSIISVEMGMHIANQIDPNTRTNMPVISFLLQNISILLFFGVGGHRVVLKSFVHSFDLFPPGSMPPPAALFSSIFSMASLVVSAGVRIAAPVYFILIVVSISVGFLAKMAPNLQVLEASFPIRIMVALLLMVLFLPAMMSAFDGLVNQVGHGLTLLLQGGG